MKTITTEIAAKNIFRIISSTASDMGVRAYVVGAYVRDFFLDRPRNDIDIVVEGDAIDFARAIEEKTHSKATYFRNFRTASLKYHGDAVQFIGAHNAINPGESRRQVIETDALRDYLQNCDFTINSLVVSLNSDDYGRLIDTVDGIKDLSKGIIRTPFQADKSFRHDAVRMLKAVRLVAQLSKPSSQFQLSPECFSTILNNSDLVESIAKERVTAELNKILLSDEPGLAISLLEQLGILIRLLKPLSVTKGVERRDGFSYEDSFPHTIKVINNIARLEKSQHSEVTNSIGIKQGEPNLWLRWAALLHDIGKPVVKRFVPGKGWTFYGYDVVGARMIKQVFTSLRLPLDERMRYVQKLISLQCRPKTLLENETSDSAYRRLLSDAGEDIEDLMILCIANITTTKKDKANQELADMEKIKQRLWDVKTGDEVRNFKSPISANYIMDLYGIEPCNALSVLKEYIKNAILNGDIENTFEEADSLLRKKAAEMGLICLQGR